jgi:hypothetical protein
MFRYQHRTLLILLAAMAIMLATSFASLWGWFEYKSYVNRLRLPPQPEVFVD